MSASPATSGRVGVGACAVALLLVACGARDGVTSDEPTSPTNRASPPSPVTMPSGGETRIDGGKWPDAALVTLPVEAAAHRDADATVRHDPGRDASEVDRPDAHRDAHADAHEGGVADGKNGDDAAIEPDCACPPDEYTIDAVVNGEAVRFSAPYVLWLYCEETTVQLVRSPCTDVYRLSACAGPSHGLPCLYVAVDVTRGPLIGHYADSTGQTWDLLAASMDVTSEMGRATVGSFEATFMSPRDAGTLAVSGQFRACTTRLPACRR